MCNNDLIVQPSIVVHCTDRLLQEGLIALYRSDSRLRPVFSTVDSEPIVRPSKALIVFPDSGLHTDRYACLHRLPVEWSLLEHPIGIAVCRLPLDLLVVLRLVESGISYLLDYDRVSADPEILVRAHLGLPQVYRLPTQWELRERLGFRWDGNIREFCLGIESVPAGTWIEEWKQSRLPISRRHISRLRRLAYESAGMPSPDFRKYSTSYRDPPVHPEWEQVRSVVRRLWGLTTSEADLFEGKPL